MIFSYFSWKYRGSPVHNYIKNMGLKAYKGSTGSAEPNFFRFKAKHVLFSAKFLPNFTKSYQINRILPIFLKKLQNVTNFLQNLRSFVAISNCCNIRVFRQICMPKNSGLTKKILFPTLHSIPYTIQTSHLYK